MSALTFDELWEKLRTHDESTQVEAKRAAEFGNSILETVSAFANEPGLGGGYLVLGVGLSSETPFPRYEIVGLPDPDRLQRELATKCRDTLSTPIRPLIMLEEREGRSVLVCFIDEAQPQEKPIYIVSRGLPAGAFRRIGSTDQRCTDEDIQLFYQLRGHRTFDEQVMSDTSIQDLDPQAIAEYRRARAEINPNAAELALSDEDLLYALAATAQHEGKTCATIAGMILFGKPASLRRHFPMTRVDYVRVEGREWVPDPERRYQSVEMLGPLMTIATRVIGQVLDDIPKAFSLAEDQLHRRDVPLIPRTVIREAVVNALMHRSYRQRQPVQVIRYANRLEIRNPGHSLIPDDRLGEPGSLARNEKIASVLHEVGLAETKGTGIRAMREAMAQANLTLPLFESDREKDTFTVTLLVHHLLGPEDIEWLAGFKECNLTDDEARALIVVREVGAINNASYRAINSMDTLAASGHLRRLRDLGLLDQKGRGPATYYVPTEPITSSEAGQLPLPLETQTEILRSGALSANAPVLSANIVTLSANTATLSANTAVLSASAEGTFELLSLPEPLAASVQALRRRAQSERVRRVIQELCAWRPLDRGELARLLHREPRYLQQHYLEPMVDAGELQRLQPESAIYSQQLYAAQPESPEGPAGE